ncbi:MAG: HD domain-containing protein [Ruminococcus sp.]|nr:HD domain-containing protein [Ruminococcus sp.]
MSIDKKLRRGSGQSIKGTLILSVLAIGLNLIGVAITSVFKLPLYLDTLGTIVAAVFGGYLPGVIVGFITNLIRSSVVDNSMYYGILNMLTALICSFAANRGWFKKATKTVALAPILIVVTAVLSTILTWYLNNSDIGGVGISVTQSLIESGISNRFAAMLVAELILEIIDKSISLALAAVIIKYTPDRLVSRIKYTGRWQNKLSEQMAAEIKKSECRSVSLRTKVVVILSAAALLIAGTSTTISFLLFKNSVINDHIKLANGLAGLEVEVIDGDRVDDYIEQGDDAEGYRETEERLYELRESSPDVQYVYVYKIMEDGCHVVFDLDTDELEGSEPGTLVEFDESFKQYIPDLLAGKEIEPIISNDQYGWLLTVYKPVNDSNGDCVCYAAIDISMDLLSAYGKSFMAKLVSLLLSFFVIILTAVVWLVEYNVILPINTMAYSAGAFAYNSEEAREGSVERIRDLDITTGDEVENLYHAFLKTTEDSMSYVADIQNKTEEISKMQNGLILVLADMVESRDQCTGDHVKKTSAYVSIILDEMKQLGIYEEQLTDEFAENLRNAAPLHDIGKIHVSDVILNKPGRLTDEEFEIMKTHTTLGSEIIDRAISMVSDSGYLREAKDVSEYHHEKWNGEGYPHGISGEDIPLSARIMAVADVFDALVSRRSYKEPFSFEKAMSIIREESGTHFDPKVVEAFVSAEDRVRKVAEDFDKMN